MLSKNNGLPKGNSCFQIMQRIQEIHENFIKFILLMFAFSVLIFTSSCTVIDNDDDHDDDPIETYSITFVANFINGDDHTFDILSTEKIIDLAPNLSREGYTFIGWFENENGDGTAYDTSKTINNDLTLYAKWEFVNYTITYHLDEQSFNLSGNITKTLEDIMPTQIDTPQRVFIGWFDNPSFLGEPIQLSAQINQNFVLYGKWDQLIYSVNLVTAIPGDSIISLSVPKDVYISNYLSFINRYGYEVDAWYSDITLTQPVDLSTLMNISITLYAGWKDVNTEYYVSTTGSDDDEGSSTYPLKTFDKAVDLMTPGDTMIVFGGTYSEQLMIDKSGTEDAWLSFMAYPNDEVVIDGTGITTDLFGIWYGMINAVEQDYIIIDGFKVINSSGSAIFISDNHHIHILNNHTINSQNPGIFVWQVDDLLIDGNEVESACMHPESGLEDISLRNNKRVIISNNYVHDSDNIGIDVAGGAQHVIVFNNLIEYVGLGLYVDAWDGELFDVQIFDNISRYNNIGLCVNTENGGSVNDVKVYNNLIYGHSDDGMVIGWGGVQGKTLDISEVHYYSNKIYDNAGDGIVIYGREYSTISQIYIYNNYVYDNEGGGIQISGLSADNPFVMNEIWVVHNTVVDNGSASMWFSGGIGIGSQENAIGTMNNIYVQNNIVSNNFTFSMAVWPWGKQPDSITMSHNLVYGYRNAADFGETKGLDFIETDPMFTDLANNDFHLLPSSSAIDAGFRIDMIVSDYEFDPRTLGFQDIGADEYIMEE